MLKVGAVQARCDSRVIFDDLDAPGLWLKIVKNAYPVLTNKQKRQKVYK
jgi:hypothetical protein